MEMYIEQGVSRMDCELKITSKYRRPFQIIRQKEIKIGGFLGLFAKPGVQVEFYFSQSQKPNNAGFTGGYNPLSPVSWPAADNSNLYSFQPQTSERFSDEEKKRLLAAASEASAAKMRARQAAQFPEAVPAKLPAAPAKYPAIQTTGNLGGKEASQQILDALKDLAEKVEQTGRGAAAAAKKEDPPAFVRVFELLKANDFTESYINTMIDRLRKELTLDQAQDFDFIQERLLELIGESISIFKEDEEGRKPRIMALIGPTGAGKTTTIAKLAAIYGIGTEGIPAADVRMITIDAFRICAKEQLEQIGNIMQIPVSCVVNKMDLKKEIALHSGSADLFFIDTIGKSPKDAAKLGKMKEILDGLPKHAEFHLVIHAATKASDIENIIQQFEPFNYKSIIISKMDETSSFGNVISALAAKRKSISYITNGQTVPVDIRRASVTRFLVNLDGFKINREKIEKRFPSGEAEQFKWR